MRRFFRVLKYFIILMLFAGSAYATFPINSSWDSIDDGWACINRTRGGLFPSDHHTIDNSSGTPDPSNALKIIYPQGWKNGGEPYHCWNVFGSQYEEIWVQYYFKYSSNYYFHGTDNKQTYYLIGTGSSNFYISTRGNRKISLVTQTYANDRHNSNTGHDPVIIPGQWYKLNAHFVMNKPGELNGIAQIWIDNRMVLNKNTIGYRSVDQAGEGFREMTITPVFGGMGSTTKPAEDYQWYDKTIVQTTDPRSSKSAFINLIRK